MLAGEGDSETERVEMLSSAPRPKTRFYPEQISSNSTCILLPLEPVAFHWKAEWKQELWGCSQPCPGPACFLLAEPWRMHWGERDSYGGGIVVMVG